jgi:ankyrin repeat protein
LAAIESFASSLPAAPLSALVSSDAARLKLRTSQSAVAPKQVYPQPTETERAYLDAARVGDWAAMLRALQPPRPYELPEASSEEGSAYKPASFPSSRVRLGIADPRTGATALHLLAALGAEECIERLLHLHLSMPLAPPPLSSSLDNSSVDARLLPLDVNARASNLATPLHWAAGNGHAGTVAALLRAGADPRARSVTWNHTVFGRGSGQTPAHWAAESGHLDCVRLLHAASPACAAMLDERLASPRDVAQKAAQPAVAHFLKEAAQEEYVCVEIQLRWQGEKLLHARGQQGAGVES